MKKAVVTILLVLPFIMIIMISFAARIVSNYQFIGVERVCLVKNEKSCYVDTDNLKVNLNSTLDLEVRIYPEFATNKNVSYISSDENILMVDENGVVTGVNYGTATIKVISQDKRDIQTSIKISVQDDFVSSVELNEKQLTLNKKQTYQLTATINPYTSLNKSVVWSSSNSSVVSVDSNGFVRALSSGIATITVTSVDGNKSDTCVITVNQDVDFGFVDYEEGKSVYMVNESEIDLKDLLIYNSSLIDINDVTFEVAFGEYVSIEGSELVLKNNKLIRVVAKVRNTNYVTEILLKYIEN